MKKILKFVLYYSILFAVITLSSFLYYNYTTEGGYSIGFPFKFYSEFQLRGNDFMNFGWYLDNFLYDVLIILFVFILVTFLVRRKNNK